MPSWIAPALSVLALSVSALTFWLTLVRRGHIQMTQPTQVYLGGEEGVSKAAKVFIGALLYATSKRGRVAENIYATVSRGESRQTFNVWVHGEKNNLVRGSGLFVGESGVARSHHFLLPPDATDYVFKAGLYRIEIFVKTVGDSGPRRVAEIVLTLSESDAQHISDGRSGIYFDWGPDSAKYHSRLWHAPAPPPVVPRVAPRLPGRDDI